MNLKPVSTTAELHHAIDKATPGSIVRLAPGEYRLDKTLELSHDLVLEGTTPELTQLTMQDGRGPILQARVPGTLVLRNLTFAHHFDPETDWEEVFESRLALHTVLIEQGHVLIEHCRFLGAQWNYTHGGGGSGLALTGQVTGFVRACEATKNWTGISLSSHGNIRLEGCLTRENENVGIECDERFAGVVYGNTCEKNGVGISVSDEARPTVMANICRENLAPDDPGYESTGIVVRSQAGGLVQDNQCEGNGMDGIGVYDHAHPVLRDNVCTANGGYGIRYGDAAGGAATGNRCEHNHAGIGLSGQGIAGCTANPVLSENILRENGIGLLYEAYSGGQASNNICEGNGDGGIVVRGRAHPHLSNNQIHQNEGPGLRYEQEGGGAAISNTIQQNSPADIRVESRVPPFLSYNLTSSGRAEALIDEVH